MFDHNMGRKVPTLVMQSAPNLCTAGLEPAKYYLNCSACRFSNKCTITKIAYKKRYILLIWQVVRQTLLCREFARLLPVLTFCSPDQGASTTFHQTYNIVTF